MEYPVDKEEDLSTGSEDVTTVEPDFIQQEHVHPSMARSLFVSFANCDSDSSIRDPSAPSLSNFASLCPHDENYYRERPEDEEDLPMEEWLDGGTFGSRNATLIFRSSALAHMSDAAIQKKPGFKLHITYKVSQAETKLLSKLLDCHGISEVGGNSSDFNLLWTGSHLKPGTLRALSPFQRVNHFPRSYELTRKDRLYKNIERMQHMKGFKHFDFIPQTFIMPTEFRELCNTHYRIKGPWIVKPVASSRGRGIFIVENPNQVPLDEPVVVAKYLNNPLLVNGHKCDLRLYVLVTSFDPLIVYLYEEGLVRFATVPYDPTHKQLWNPCMHLCNYSINKYHSDYVKSDDPSEENVGHKWTLSALLRHLKAQGKDTALLMSQVEDLVVKAVLSSTGSIVSACQIFVQNIQNCFELYGFDILIDENLKPWLLEVNLSPSLNCDSPLDVRLKSAMLADLLTLVGIPAVDPIVKISGNGPEGTSNIKLTNADSNRMKMGGYKRVQSMDGLNSASKKSSKFNTLANSTPLSAEEIKIVKVAKQQFSRRGGFVRIFPTADCWVKYSQYLHPTTGIPLTTVGSSTYNVSTLHNYNWMLFTQLFPNVAVTTSLRSADRTSRDHSIDRCKRKDFKKKNEQFDSTAEIKGAPSLRQDRYERALTQGHKDKNMFCMTTTKSLVDSQSEELKKQVVEIIKSGKHLTQVEVRKIFSQYLACVLKKMTKSPEDEAHVEVVIQFLQKASNYLRTPFVLKIPSNSMIGKDRTALIAKQLNDFLYLYNRETEAFCNVLDRPSQLPNELFVEFIEHARECQLEEVIILQTLHKVPTKPNHRGFKLILKCLPNSSCLKKPILRSTKSDLL